jgi:short subunit fatty acids transporter
MSQIITFEEMKQRYQGEWLLIAYKDLDDQMQVIEGEVLAHSPNQSHIYEILASIPEQPLAIEYVGQIPEDVAFIL